MNLEISENPKVLLDAAIPVRQLRLLERRLYDSASLLTLDEATDAAGRNPDGITGCRHRDGRVFYMREGTEVEYFLSERISAVIQHGGWLRFPNHYGFRIRYGKVVEFAVHGGVLAFFQNLSKSDIVEHFGKADFVDEIVAYGDLIRTTFVYNRKIRVSYDDADNRIDMINIGESLIFGEHGKLESPWPVTH